MESTRRIQKVKSNSQRAAANGNFQGRSAAQLMPEEELAQGKSISQLMEDEELMQGKFVNQLVAEEELAQGKFSTSQLMEEEEPMQGKFITAQLAGEEEELAQGKFKTVQRKPAERVQLQEQSPENNTGMSDQLKSGMENLSGVDLSDVRVHYNSSKPAQMNAHAYAQGTDIHVASGQEKHVPHEAWHTVQQKQGRVQPTTSVGGMPVNDNVSLEKEADVMGAKALQTKSITSHQLKEED